MPRKAQTKPEASNEVAVVAPEFAPPILTGDIDPAEMIEVAQENSGDQLTIDKLRTIKMPSVGSTTFQVPTLEHPDGEPQEEVQGIIVGWKEERVYYRKKYNPNDVDKPDCFSRDGKIGVGSPGGNCAACSLAKFGEDDEPPKCKLYNNLLILREGSMLPDRFRVAPNSHSEFKKYRNQLTLNIKAFWKVITGFTYKDSKVIFSYKGDVNKDYVPKLKEYKEVINTGFVESGNQLPAGEPTQAIANNTGKLNSAQANAILAVLPDIDKPILAKLIFQILGQTLNSFSDIPANRVGNILQGLNNLKKACDTNSVKPETFAAWIDENMKDINLLDAEEVSGVALALRPEDAPKKSIKPEAEEDASEDINALFS